MDFCIIICYYTICSQTDLYVVPFIPILSLGQLNKYYFTIGDNLMNINNDTDNNTHAEESTIVSFEELHSGNNLSKKLSSKCHCIIHNNSNVFDSCLFQHTIYRQMAYNLY